ncbi:helicase-related protein [Campylobacter sp. MOP7]|uniref:helicase-related protein n=1 Tax=Campylobacter canis TaxID=3378588 RepID=UPI00387E64EB
MAKYGSFAELLNNDSVIATLLEQVPDATTSGNIIAQDDSEAVSVDLNNKVLKLLGEMDVKKHLFAKQLSKGTLPLLAAILPERLGGLNRKGALLNGQMGTGKTGMSFVLAYLYAHLTGMINKGFKLLMMTDKDGLIAQMRDEARDFIGNGDCLEIYTIKTKPRVTRGEITLEQAYTMRRTQGKITLFVMSKDTGKNSYKWDKVVGKKCPECGAILPPDNTHEGFCPSCKAKLYKVVSGKVSFAAKIKQLEKIKKDSFDLFLMDEAHSMQDPNSLQSCNYRAFVRSSKRVILMTGTLSNGYASSMFHILYPVFFKEMKEMGFSHDRVQDFVSFFGTTRYSERIVYNGGWNGRARRHVRSCEEPKVNYRIVPFCLNLGATITVEDLDLKMPPLKERRYIVDVESDLVERVNFHIEQIRRLEKKMGEKHVSRFSHLAFKNYALNNPTKLYSHKVTGIGKDLAGFAVELTEVCETRLSDDPDFISNKERKLIELVNNEIAEGRRTLLYTNYTETNEVQERLASVLNNAGIKADIINSNIKSSDILDRMKDFEGDVMIVSQRRVETGFNLTMFHTVIFYELSDQIRVVQQAKCRPWRPVGQDKEVRVFYLAYRGEQLDQLNRTGLKVVSTTVSSGQRILSDSIADLYDYQRGQTAAIQQTEGVIARIQGDQGIRKYKMTPFEETYSAFVDSIQAKPQEDGAIIEPDDNDDESKNLTPLCVIEEIEVDLSAVADAPTNGTLFPDEVLNALTDKTKPCKNRHKRVNNVVQGLYGTQLSLFA